MIAALRPITFAATIAALKWVTRTTAAFVATFASRTRRVVTTGAVTMRATATDIGARRLSTPSGRRLRIGAARERRLAGLVGFGVSAVFVGMARNTWDAFNANRRPTLHDRASVALTVASVILGWQEIQTARAADE